MKTREFEKNIKKLGYGITHISVSEQGSAKAVVYNKEKKTIGEVSERDVGIMGMKSFNCRKLTGKQKIELLSILNAYAETSLEER